MFTVTGRSPIYLGCSLLLTKSLTPGKTTLVAVLSTMDNDRLEMSNPPAARFLLFKVSQTLTLLGQRSFSHYLPWMLTPTFKFWNHEIINRRSPIYIGCSLLLLNSEIMKSLIVAVLSTLDAHSYMSMVPKPTRLVSQSYLHWMLTPTAKW